MPRVIRSRMERRGAHSRGYTAADKHRITEVEHVRPAHARASAHTESEPEGKVYFYDRAADPRLSPTSVPTS